MPRHILSDTTALREWMNVFVASKDYAVISTDDNEIILEPLRSTRPIDFGYVKVKGDAKEMAARLAKESERSHVHLKRFEWDTDKPVGVKQVIEENSTEKKT